VLPCGIRLHTNSQRRRTASPHSGTTVLENASLFLIKTQKEQVLLTQDRSETLRALSAPIALRDVLIDRRS
jgi:hypothetical protein